MSVSHISNVVFSGIFVFLAVGLCIFIHELGHFLVARWRGLHVIAFSMGFKKIWSFKRGGVEYRIGCIPFGGYVELPQIDGSGEPKDEHGNPLPKASPLDKILTAAAGPLCNVLLGVAFACVIWFAGIPSESPRMSEFEVAYVDETSPEYAAGLRKGDVIERFNGKRFNCTWQEFVEKIIFSIGDVSLGVRRGDQRLLVSYLPAENEKRFPGEKIAYPFFTPRIPVVVRPLKGSPAENAGIRANDIIVAVNASPVNDAAEFSRLIDASGDKPVTLTVSRDGRLLDIPGIVPEKVKTIPPFYRIGIQYSTEPPPTIVDVSSGSPADKAGMRPGDVILEINDKKIDTPALLYEEIQRSASSPLKIKLKRGDEIIHIQDIRAELYQARSIGVLFAYYQYPSPAKLFVETMEKSYKTIRGIFSSKSKLKARNLSGPVGIVHSVGKIIYTGHLAAAIYFMAFISYSLAIFNLLPIPVLDGGHILIACIECAIGRPLPEKMLKPIYAAIVALLVGLMIFVTYYDLVRLARDLR